jgi:CheY-like chemotaxis protein
MATVLVVEDEFGIADLIAAVLEDEGHRILMAANGKLGLEMLGQERPHLVFLDYMMPVMDGASMLRSMATDPSFRDIPVVMMSSLPEATMVQRCDGYTAFMRKPFKITDVVSLTERLIGTRSESQ